LVHYYGRYWDTYSWVALGLFGNEAQSGFSLLSMFAISHCYQHDLLKPRDGSTLVSEERLTFRFNVIYRNIDINR